MFLKGLICDKTKTDLCQRSVWCWVCRLHQPAFTPTYWRHRYSAIGKHLKNDHGLETISDLTNNFSVLKKCNGKLDCLIYEMLFIKKKGHAWAHNQTPYVQNYLLFVTIYYLSHAYFTFYRLARHILKCKILFSFHLKMMTWSHQNVV